MKSEHVKNILSHNLSLLVGNISTGKTLLSVDLLKSYNRQFNGSVWAFGLKTEVLEDCDFIKSFSSLLELEQITDSIILIDEVGLLFNLDDRKQKKQIETILRLLEHNNNKVIISGVPEDFKKFLSGKAQAFLYKSLSKSDLINGSETKTILGYYKGLENGVLSLQLPIDECLFYSRRANKFEKIKASYTKKADTKRDNKDLFVARGKK